MSNNKPLYQANLSTQLALPADLSQSRREHYKRLHQDLPKMSKNQLNITGVELKANKLHTIKITAFIRSTIEKPVALRPTRILLLDKNLEPFAETVATLSNLGTLFPNTSKLFSIQFVKEDFIQFNLEQLDYWSVAFKENSKHRIDFSDFDAHKLSESTKIWLTEFSQNEPLAKNELSFLGFSAELDESNNLLVHLLIRNGTHDDLKIKQLPLKFHDATKEIVAKGIFTFEGLIVQAKTSRPIALVFPASTIKKDHLDLSKWLLLHDK